MTTGSHLKCIKGVAAERPAHDADNGLIRFRELYNLLSNLCDIGLLTARVGNEQTDLDPIGQPRGIVELLLSNIGPLQVFTSYPDSCLIAGQHGGNDIGHMWRTSNTLIFQVNERFGVIRFLSDRCIPLSYSAPNIALFEAGCSLLFERSISALSINGNRTITDANRLTAYLCDANAIS